MAASFFEQSDTHHLTSMFDNLWNTDFVLAATHVGCRQLSRLEISPYQGALLARGVCHRHRGQVLDGQMEQAMGYTGTVGTMLMDEMAGICGRVSERVFLVPFFNFIFTNSTLVPLIFPSLTTYAHIKIKKRQCLPLLKMRYCYKTKQLTKSTTPRCSHQSQNPLHRQHHTLHQRPRPPD